MLERVNVLSGINRIGAHTHVRTLGVDEDMLLQNTSGIIGLSPQRRALFLLLKLCRNNQGRMALLSGPSCSGKSALIYALAQDLKKEGLPYFSIAASEVFSSSLGKTEVLTQSIRKAIGMQLKEKHRVLEGEVVSIHIDRENTSSGKITLKTTDAESIFTLGEGIIRALHEEGVSEGDIVRINKSTGTVKKQGRSLSRIKDYEALGPILNAFPTPEGELLSVKEESHTVTLHEVDMINTKNKGYLSLLSSATEIPAEVRDAVDSTMQEWMEEKKGIFRTGAFIIEEAHLLDTECHAFLNTVAELKISPTIILVTSKKIESVLPPDLLSRVLLISIPAPTPEEIEGIVAIRAQEESVHIEEAALQEICNIAQKKGLRYALNLLSASDALFRRISRTISVSDVGLLVQIFPCAEVSY